MVDEKKVFLNGEADSYFIRNKDTLIANGEVSYGIKLLIEFLNRQDLEMWDESKKILEIGACYGYNLKYLSDRINIECYGIEPSIEAINYGKLRYKDNSKIHLVCGTSDELPYKDSLFDVVVLGCCMFWVDRKYLMKTVSEVDRVLKDGGYLAIIDFDTSVPYKRDNIHNHDAWTYKMQYINLFLSNPQYYMVDRKCFSRSGQMFCKEVQERISFNVLYKDNVDNSYIKA